MTVLRKISTLSVSRQPDSDSADFVFFNRTRFLVLLITTLCMSISQSNTLTLNFTIICMTGTENTTTTPPVSDMEGGVIVTPLEAPVEATSDRYSYSPSEKNLLFSAVAVGAMIAVYPVMFLIEKFGSRWICFWVGMFSALTTALIPLAASWSFIALLIARLLQGVGLSTAFCLTGIVTRQWSMLKQSGFFIAFLTTFFQIAPIFTMPVAGALCTSSLGWPSVYYLHAALTVVIFAVFVYFYREQPIKHKFVSGKELDRIQRLKGDTTKKDPVPIKAIVTSIPIIAVWVAALANFLGIQVTMQFSPTYLNKVLGFPIERTGLYSAIPQIATFFLKLFAGAASDRFHCCSPRMSVKIFNHLALGGMGLCFVALAFIPTSEPTLGLVFLIFCCSIIGFNCGAFFKSSAIVAQQHNHFVMGVNSFLNCLAALLAPVIVNIFAKDDTWDEWWNVWITFAVILISADLVFAVFGKAEPAEWTKSVLPCPNTRPLTCSLRLSLFYTIWQPSPVSTPSSSVSTIAPRSHPRPGQFSVEFGDGISVDVAVFGPDKCDTCQLSRSKASAGSGVTIDTTLTEDRISGDHERY